MFRGIIMGCVILVSSPVVASDWDSYNRNEEMRNEMESHRIEQDNAMRRMRDDQERARMEAARERRDDQRGAEQERVRDDNSRAYSWGSIR